VDTASVPSSTASSDNYSSTFSRDQFASEMVLNHLHHMNQTEIQLAQLAEERASSEQFKTMSKQMLTDYQSFDSRVQEIAKSMNFSLDSYQPATYDRSALERLRSLSGSQFDQAFSWVLYNNHQDSLQDLRGFRKEVKNPQINSLINQVMPKIQQHASMWDQYRSTQMGGQAGSDETSMSN
jgi:predicted outer membrane protein